MNGDEHAGIEYRCADGRVERLPRLALELVSLNADAIVVTGSQATTAARQATATIPIVMAGVGDPVAIGLIAGLARPGGNITGVSAAHGDISSKRLELLLSPRETACLESTEGAITSRPEGACHMTPAVQAWGNRAPSMSTSC